MAPAESPPCVTTPANRHCSSGLRSGRTVPGEFLPPLRRQVRVQQFGSASTCTVPEGSVPRSLSLCRPAAPSALGSRRVFPGEPEGDSRDFPKTQESGLSKVVRPFPGASDFLDRRGCHSVKLPKGLGTAVTARIPDSQLPSFLKLCSR